jgi:hypothetical protein
VQKQSLNTLRPRSSQTVGALTLVLVLLLLSFLATDAHAHESIHEDAHLPEHECIVTLFAQGQLTGFSTPVAAVDAPDELCVAVLHTITAVFTTRRYVLPPSCGPPAAV